jgi:DNA-binding XRE family transcriptional regulator
MTKSVKPAELREARKRLGLTQHGLAAALRMGKNGWQSVSRWEQDGNTIPGPVQIAVESLLEGKVTHSISTNPQKPRYAVCGPVPSRGGGRPSWMIVDTKAPQPGSKIVEYVQGRDEAVRRAAELNLAGVGSSGQCV